MIWPWYRMIAAGCFDPFAISASSFFAIASASTCVKVFIGLIVYSVSGRSIGEPVLVLSSSLLWKREQTYPEYQPANFQWLLLWYHLTCRYLLPQSTLRIRPPPLRFSG